MTNYGFDTDEVKYDSLSLPVGRHKVMVAKEEIKETENPKNPKLLKVTYEILEGELKGKQYFHSYNIFHQNPTTSSIAKQDIKRIADVTGRTVNAESPLLRRVFTVIVQKQKKDPQYTEIAKYLPIDAEDNSAPF